MASVDQPTDDDCDRERGRPELCTMRDDVAAAPDRHPKQLAAIHAADAIFCWYGAFTFAVTPDARPSLGLPGLDGCWLDRAPGDEQHDHNRPGHAQASVATSVLMAQ
jgi:hypothetical protein